MTNDTISEAPPISLVEGLLQREPPPKGPLHAVVRAELDNLIDCHFEDGQRFWTESVLSEHMNVSRITVRRALHDLTKDGRLSRYRAKGTFVRKRNATPRVSEISRFTAFSVVGIFVPRWTSTFWSELMEEINAICQQHDLQLRVYHTRAGESGDQAALQVQLRPDKEALIFLGNDPDTTRGLYESLHTRGYRTVAVDTLLPDLPNAYVGTNNDLGIRLGMRHLMDLGHRRIVLAVTEPEHLTVIKTRINAFRDVVEMNGLTEASVANLGNVSGQDPYEVVYGKMPEIWERRPTAIFAISDTGAWGALKWLNEQGIRIPDQVSVMGFDDLRPSQYTLPSLTSVGQPCGDLARIALETLERGDRSQALLPPTLSVRRSTGPAPVERS